MPKIARLKGFFDSTKRPHVHVARSRGYGQAAKLWMIPEIEIAERGSLTQKELDEVVRLLCSHRDEIEEQLERIRRGENVKTLNFN